ncbi:MAG: hypothetical protein GQ540_02050 [Lutibacter sp.]|uniref:hypothetical protein n=1 Tax=Lutibacter sp. TaxID=1925666 RepID=UPI001A0326DD|nr:hypothetical protein [Lutibacter sp.]NOR27290.1 hypothetical protein [Lutibacter sp.]
MKKFYYLLSSIAVITMITVSCEKSSFDEETIKSIESLSEKAQVKPDIRAKGLELFWDLEAVDGYLFTDDISQGKLWGWTDNTVAYGNISAPIAYYLYKSGLKEPALAGFEAMYARTSSDFNNPSNFNSADLGVLLYAYRVTEDTKFLTLVNNMASTWTTKYPSTTGLPFLRGEYGIWGYDGLNLARNIYYIFHTSGVDSSLVAWAKEAKDEYEIQQMTYDADYDIVFENVSANIYKVGVFNPLATENIKDMAADAQVLAYAKIGRTTKKNFYDEMLENLFELNGEVSEQAAEIIFALSR